MFPRQLESISLAAIAVAALAVSGCVSTQRYRKLESDLTEQNKKLTNAEKKIDELTTVRAQLEDTTQTLAEQKAALEKAQEEQKKTYDQLVNELQGEIDEGEVAITQYKDKLSVNVADRIFFDSGQTKIKQSGRQVLARVGKVLKNVTDKQILVEGHTDNVKIAKALQSRYPTNWELSAARATNVVRFLQDQAGIDGSLLVAVGRGEFRPIAPNDTPEGRQKNRRIEILLQDKEVDTLGRRADAAPAAPAEAASAQ